MYSDGRNINNGIVAPWRVGFTIEAAFNSNDTGEMGSVSLLKKGAPKF